MTALKSSGRESRTWVFIPLIRIRMCTGWSARGSGGAVPGDSGAGNTRAGPAADRGRRGWGSCEGKALLAAGANVNAKDNDGWTALMYAAEMGRTEIVNLLKAAGAKG